MTGLNSVLSLLARHVILQYHILVVIDLLVQLQENNSVLYLLAKLNYLDNCEDVADMYVEKLLAHPDTNTLDLYALDLCAFITQLILLYRAFAACDMAREYKR